MLQLLLTHISSIVRKTSFQTVVMTEQLGTYDEVLEKIGQFGPWQKKIILFLWLPPILAGMGFMQYSFAAGTPKSRCLVPLCESYSNEIQ